MSTFGNYIGETTRSEHEQPLILRLHPTQSLIDKVAPGDRNLVNWVPKRQPPRSATAAPIEPIEEREDGFCHDRLAGALSHMAMVVVVACLVSSGAEKRRQKISSNDAAFFLPSYFPAAGDDVTNETHIT